MSIFTKSCPVCGASQPPEAARCSCGHRFDTGASDSETQDLQSIYHEERLYRDYLVARVDEAAKGADKEALASARVELEAQEQRVRAVKKRLKLMRSNAPAKKPETPPAAKPAPPAAPKSAASPTRPSARIRQKNPSTPTGPKSPAPTSQQPPTPKTASAHPVAQQRSSVRTQSKPAAARQPVRAAVQPSPKPKPPVAATPPPAKSTASVSSAARPGVAPAPSSRTGASNQAATQECPNCMAKVPVGVARCGCGFEMLSHANEMPSLPMSSEDRAAFLAALRPTRAPRSGK